MPSEAHRVTSPRLNTHSIGGGKIAEMLVSVLHRNRFVTGYGIIVITTLFLLPALSGAMQGDTSLYQSISQDLLQGKLPYRDRVLEYPPYVIPIFVLPRISGDMNYLISFMGMGLFVDWLIKFLLLMAGWRHSKTSRGLLPVLCYSLAVPFLCSFYLQRYDVWLALICLMSVWLFCSGRYFLCGLAIAIGIGLKVYPAIFVPPLFALAARQGNGRRFMVGLAFGLLPIMLMSFFLPWWRFVQFQGGRGLQVESLYATLLWLAQQLGLANVQWAWDRSWFEIHGPLASAILPWARGLFMVSVIFSTAVVTWAATRRKQPSLSELARLLLVPLLAFVAFNVVLSPQYMIWLLPLAALASLEGNCWPMLAISFATMLTPIIFPAFYDHYSIGWKLPDTLVVVLRNFILITVWAVLVLELTKNNQKICLSSKTEVPSGN